MPSLLSHSLTDRRRRTLATARSSASRAPLAAIVLAARASIVALTSRLGGAAMAPEIIDTCIPALGTLLDAGSAHQREAALALGMARRLQCIQARLLRHADARRPAMLARRCTGDRRCGRGLYRASLPLPAAELFTVDKFATSSSAVGTIKRLVAIVVLDPSDSAQLNVQEAAFLALAALTVRDEECRREALDLDVASAVVKALKSDHEGVRDAACQCARSLSRSVAALRTTLLDAGLAQPMMTVCGCECRAVGACPKRVC